MGPREHGPSHMAQIIRNSACFGTYLIATALLHLTWLKSSEINRKLKKKDQINENSLLYQEIC